MKVTKFISQEVTNQGFVGAQHAVRVAWMTEAWEWFQEATQDGHMELDLGTVEYLGTLIEHYANEAGFRCYSKPPVNVTVGGRVCPDWSQVHNLMLFWTKYIVPHSPPIEVYRTFQLIHPFRDGNGRVGKVIYNWLLERLDDPVFPIDLFGGGIP
jgi:Fic/DOC family